MSLGFWKAELFCVKGIFLGSPATYTAFKDGPQGPEGGGGGGGGGGLLTIIPMLICFQRSRK